MNRTNVFIRIDLVYGLYLNGGVGLWATVAPRSFYDDFPGLGRSWVSLNGPYNEHLVRDVGAWALALCVLLVAAAWTMTRPMLITAGVAMTVAAVPHTLYHLRHIDTYPSSTDKVAGTGGLVVGALLGIFVLVAALLRPAAPS